MITNWLQWSACFYKPRSKTARHPRFRCAKTGTREGFLLVAFLGVLFSCSHTKSRSNIRNDNYNFSIIFNYSDPRPDREDTYRYRVSDNSLYLFFESEFVNDTITILINDTKKSEYVLNTEYSTGIAKVVELDDFKEIRNVGVSINSSPSIRFDIVDSKMNLIGIDKSVNQVNIKFYTKVPIYD